MSEQARYTTRDGYVFDEHNKYFCLVYHIGDEEKIADALNDAEKVGKMREALEKIVARWEGPGTADAYDDGEAMYKIAIEALATTEVQKEGKDGS